MRFALEIGQVTSMKMTRQLKLRDHMDEILESYKFYRKKVGRGRESIFRSVADVLFTTQHYKDTIKNALNKFRRTEAGIKLFDEGNNLDHKEARAISIIFNISIEVVSSCDPLLRALVITPNGSFYSNITSHNSDDDDISSHDSALSSTMERHLSGEQYQDHRVLLCYTKPDQYDPIYEMSLIEASGVAQSIIYQVLYEEVFGLKRSFEAAQLMLSEKETGEEKPTIFDPNFEGQPLEALRQHKIPFRYKVAKALNPREYRNIEYDVWSLTMRKFPHSTTSGSGCQQSKRTSISWVNQTTPVLPDQGFIQAPMSSPRLMEIPFGGTMLMPSTDSEQNLLSSREGLFQGIPHTVAVTETTTDEPLTGQAISHGSLFEAQLRNNSLVMYDKDWEKKFDYSIPPPTPCTPVCTTAPCSALPSTPILETSSCSNDDFFTSAVPLLPGCAPLMPTVIMPKRFDNEPMILSPLVHPSTQPEQMIPSCQYQAAECTPFPTTTQVQNSCCMATSETSTVMWLPLIINSPSSVCNSLAPPGTPLSTPFFSTTGPNYFTFDQQIVTQSPRLTHETGQSGFCYSEESPANL